MTQAPMTWFASDFGKSLDQVGASDEYSASTPSASDVRGKRKPGKAEVSREDLGAEDECVFVGAGIKGKRTCTTSSIGKRLKVGNGKSGMSALEEYQAKQTAQTRGKSRDMWIDRYGPKTKADLAINAKKLNELEAWLKGLQSGTSRRIMVVTGPSGAGKSTAVRVLSCDLGITVTDLENPDGGTFDPNGDNSSWESNTSLLEHHLCASKYGPACWEGSAKPSISSRRPSSVTLIEEIPALCLKDPKNLHSLLRRFCSPGKTGIVFIITENNASNSRLWTLFPPQIIADFNITLLKFNPITTTALRKHFMAVANKELSRTTAPTMAEIDELIAICRGDIRAGMTALEFSVESRNLPSKRGGPTAKSGTLGFRNGDPDKSIILFRAIGRVFYVKRNVDEPPNCLGLPDHLLQEARRPLTYTPETIIEKCCTTEENYVAFVHENYPNFIIDMDFVQRAAECFSLTDIILSEWTNDEARDQRVRDLAGSVAVRGLLHLQRAESAVKFHAIVKPAATEVRKKIDERRVQGKALAADRMSAFVNTTTLFSDLLPYWGRILSLRGVHGSFLQDISTFNISRSQYRRETLLEDEWYESSSNLTAPGEAVSPVTPPSPTVPISDLDLQFADICTDDWDDGDFDQPGPSNTSTNIYDTSHIQIEEMDDDY
ncbi:putative Cell cycle checkpoint protein RAD17 [Hypsibius exemplaris]|uniref:Cell cycle checkpoint protein RAD17 n=1 Tax=Hypsibius exemplaris TaxID=2072580 RepID=A0A1W0X1E5_HYPEX|nr:putative Cell cycle checkpoint protein RAD17 [Hypsibius exemplaris]